MKQLTITFLITGLLYTGQAMADAAMIEQGSAVYQHWCTPCHGNGEGYPGTVALAAKYQGQIPAVLDQRSDLTGEFVKTFVRQGISIMPFFRHTEISDADLDAIVAYLRRNSE